MENKYLFYFYTTVLLKGSWETLVAKVGLLWKIQMHTFFMHS